MRLANALPAVALLLPALALATRYVPTAQIADRERERERERHPADVESLGDGLFRVPMPDDPAAGAALPFDAADDLSTRLSKLLAARPELARAERSLRVDKTHYVLEARVGDLTIKRYVVNLGFQPVGHKQQQGDGRTPEGRYFIRNKHDSAYTRFFGLSYPAARDADRGLSSGLIDARTASGLAADERAGRMPDWRTRLGGAVGIHGGGAFRDEGRTALLKNWTWGCIALRNEDIRDLDRFTREGLPVDVTQ
jgi:hypothetical protein